MNVAILSAPPTGTIVILSSSPSRFSVLRIEEKIITENKILFYSNAVKKDFSDIEDLFTKEEYLNLYNNAFRKEIKLSDLDKNKPIMNQLKRLNDNKAFNHYSPANYLVKNSSSITFCPSTLTKFETLFREINSLFA